MLRNGLAVPGQGGWEGGNQQVVRVNVGGIPDS